MLITLVRAKHKRDVISIMTSSTVLSVITKPNMRRVTI
jgi:hypothetical protein